MKVVMTTNELRRIIKGALRATLNDHGEIEVGSALKRIMGQIESAQKNSTIQVRRCICAGSSSPQFCTSTDCPEVKK